MSQSDDEIIPILRVQQAAIFQANWKWLMEKIDEIDERIAKIEDTLHEHLERTHKSS